MRKKQIYRAASVLIILLTPLIFVSVAKAQSTETSVLDDDAIEKLLHENKIPALWRVKAKQLKVIRSE